eukprot:TRINITY_DN113873_c0_g1_i1.p1 TRINITY_DN113873_c0_g1~~TRINITY_DN113873_c0_g1_i1.p1  ORF type:complete len:179 (-),score=20.28 TRINITY_DN113873_c0_g1_i1:169-705(-)
MCRSEANTIYRQRAELEKLQVRLVAVVKENLPLEISAFREAVWPNGELFLDESQYFYRTIFGGKLSKESLASLACKTCCGSGKTLRAYRKSAAEGHSMNYVGEGLVKGGTLVYQKGGQIQAIFREDEVGEHPEPNEVIDAARLASGATPKLLDVADIQLGVAKEPPRRLGRCLPCAFA